MGFDWSKLTPNEVAHVTSIAAQVHPGFFEDAAIFAERQKLCPDGCWLLRVDGQAAGYVLSHPVKLGQLPALNSLLGSIPPDADSYYIHDMALLPAARGTGAARQLVGQLATHARSAGFATMSLVAVNASQRFWESQWFMVSPRPELAEKLKTYEDAARFMVRLLD